MPKFEKLSYYVAPAVSVVPGTKSTGAITATAVNASGGFDRVLHVIQLGAFATSAQFDAEIVESATSGGTYTMITSSGMTAVTAAAANKIVLIDVPVNNAKPFQKVRSTATTQTVGVSVVAIRYNGTRPLGTTISDANQDIYVA
jgi:hypothetical protein